MIKNKCKAALSSDITKPGHICHSGMEAFNIFTLFTSATILKSFAKYGKFILVIIVLLYKQTNIVCDALSDKCLIWVSAMHSK